MVTGLGVASAVGIGKAAFEEALMEGRHAFAVMRRPGRQKEGETAFLGAELPELSRPDDVSARLWRTASLSGRAALITLREAWQEARLHEVDPRRIGLVIGGSNLQQRELALVQARYAERLHFLRPTYGLTFLDSDLCGLCSEQFGIGGLAHMVAGASASGQLAVIEAAEAVCAGRVDCCVAIGALMDLSYWECAGLHALGAMGPQRHAADPAAACRPFDAERDGFIYGEACAAVVVERPDTAAARGVPTLGVLCGWAVTVDGHRGPDPSVAGEVRAIRAALAQAQLGPADVDYVNPHGTGSVVGDETEVAALVECGLGGARINATKSVTGHGLTAAGAVEVVATLLQMKASRLHPTPNLVEPLDPALRWVRDRPAAHTMTNALALSFGFGGLNTALCIRNPRAAR